MIKLAPSILSADFSRLEEQVKLVEKAGADIIHVDVMDGHFVPNISFGASVMKSLCGKTLMPFDVHLMIEDPDKYLEDFVTENTMYITVHQEACIHIDRTIDHIHDCGAKAGVALNPGTPVSVLDCIIEKIDLLLIMSVNPGFGGQKLIENSLKKINIVKQIKEKNNLDMDIEIDGGVNLKNVHRVIDAGAELIVAGSSIFGAPVISDRVGEFIKVVRNK